MNASIDFTKGGYQGDAIEETFKPFSTHYMPFWWHFREVLRASDRVSFHWKKPDSTVLSDDEQRELVALSSLNRAVYRGMADALAFLEQMEHEFRHIEVLISQGGSAGRVLEIDGFPPDAIA